MDMHDIGWAVKQLRRGRRVARSGWNGKNMWLVLQRGDQPGSEVKYVTKDGEVYPMLSYVLMKTATNEVVPWLCSQTDLLADDWMLVQLPELKEVNSGQ